MSIASPAMAQDIGVAHDRIVPGTSVDYIDSNGHVFRLLFLGETEAGWREERHFLSPGDTRQDDRWIGDVHGNATSVELADGSLYRFEPHNCRRVTGECAYQEIGDQVNDRYVRVNETTPNGFVSTVYWVSPTGARVFSLESTVVIDADGIVIEAKRRYADGSQYSYRRLAEGTS